MPDAIGYNVTAQTWFLSEVPAGTNGRAAALASAAEGAAMDMTAKGA